YIVAVHASDVLVRQRVHSGIWRGLFDFPSIDADEAIEWQNALDDWKAARVDKQSVTLESAPVEMLHVLSHRRVHAFFSEVRLTERIEPREAEQWIPIDQLPELGVSRLVDRYVREHSKLLGRME
ncbi:MAG: NUDIX domain-containing protein, partial [Flavobacteriales bacterium]